MCFVVDKVLRLIISLVYCIPPCCDLIISCYNLLVSFEQCSSRLIRTISLSSIVEANHRNPFSGSLSTPLLPYSISPLSCADSIDLRLTILPRQIALDSMPFDCNSSRVDFIPFETTQSNLALVDLTSISPPRSALLPLLDSHVDTAGHPETGGQLRAHRGGSTRIRERD